MVDGIQSIGKNGEFSEEILVTAEMFKKALTLVTDEGAALTKAVRSLQEKNKDLEQRLADQLKAIEGRLKASETQTAKIGAIEGRLKASDTDGKDRRN